MSDICNPKFLIAYTIIAGFFAAYIYNPSETMNGALIAAFAGAWGYFLGSSNSASVNRDQVGAALDLAKKAQPDVAVAKAESVVIDGETK